jgi:hypothetical protein
LPLFCRPVGLLLISAGRLIIVSNYNTITAVTIISSGGYINTLLGSTIPQVAIFAPYIALILLLMKRFLLSIMLFAFAAFITPSPLSLHDAARVASLDWHHMSQIVSRWAPSSSKSLIVVTVIIILSGALREDERAL